MSRSDKKFLSLSILNKNVIYKSSSLVAISVVVEEVNKRCFHNFSYSFYRVVGNTATIESEYKALKVEYSQDNGQSWEDVPNTWNLSNKFKMLLRTKYVKWTKFLKEIKQSRDKDKTGKHKHIKQTIYNKTIIINMK